MRPKELTRKALKTIGVDTRQAITGVIVVALVGGYAGLLHLSKTVLKFSLQLLHAQTPLWATIVLILLCCSYTYLQVNKILEKLKKEYQSSQSPPD